MKGIQATLLHAGQPHDRMKVVVCKLTDGLGATKTTVIRADSEGVRGAFKEEQSPLYDIDHDGSNAWVFITKPVLGYLYREERLKVLLGEEVILIGENYDWVISLA